MGIFRTRKAAEAFSKGDPFILEGLIKSYAIPRLGRHHAGVKVIVTRYAKARAATSLRGVRGVNS